MSDGGSPVSQNLVPNLPAFASAWGEVLLDSGDIGWYCDVEFRGVVQRMRWIAPGSFWMGSEPTDSKAFEDEKPRRSVKLTRGFWMAETPCTQALWEAVMGENPSEFSGGERPVERISWDDCERFLKRFQGEVPQSAFRLPTEAEWEYACRAGSTTAWSCGDAEAELSEFAWYNKNAGNETHPVGRKRSNTWGLYDMHGNVYEWCSDWYGKYDESGPMNEIDPVGPVEGDARVFRGGSWIFNARYCRSAYRYWHSPENRFNFLGFRFAQGQQEESGDGAW